MIRIALILLIFSASSYATDNALAPFPIYFTVDGSPKTIKVGNNGEAVYVTWDGKQLYMSDRPPEPPHRGPHWKGFTPRGCWAMIIFSVVSWYVTLKLIFWAIRVIKEVMT